MQQIADSGRGIVDSDCACDRCDGEAQAVVGGLDLAQCPDLQIDRGLLRGKFHNLGPALNKKAAVSVADQMVGENGAELCCCGP